MEGWPLPVNLSIKNVPDRIAKELRERAARSHRSIQGDLMSIIEAGRHEIRPFDGSRCSGARARAEAQDRRRSARHSPRRSGSPLALAASAVASEVKVVDASAMAALLFNEPIQ